MEVNTITKGLSLDKKQNKLKSEYKSAKQNTAKYKELMEWKQKQQTAFQMSNHPSEPQEPLTLEPVEPQEPVQIWIFHHLVLHQSKNNK